MKMNEWVDRFVRLSKRVESKGGAVFMKGEVMVVTGHHRGRLSLNRPARMSEEIVQTTGHAVSGVHPDDVELLPDNPREVLKVILEGAEVLARYVGATLAYEVSVDGKTRLDKFDPKKVRMFQSVSASSGVVRGSDGLPSALMLG